MNPASPRARALAGLSGYLAGPYAALLSVLTLLSLLALLAGPGPSASLVLLAAVTLTATLAASLGGGARVAAAAAIPLGGRAAALREKSWRAGFLPQRDPDAPGRARPRAPSAAPAAA